MKLRFTLLLLLCFLTLKAQLLQKYTSNPVLNTGAGLPPWRSLHVANATIVTPSETSDGKWRLFVRGSGNNADGYHDNIGMLDQTASSFSPYGPWTEYGSNPILPHGASGYDAMHVLDAAARKGANGNIHLYYMARDNNNVSSLCGATSSDGGFSFTKFTSNPMKYDVGPNDMVYYNNQYYVFYGDAKWNGNGFSEKLQIHLSVSSQPSTMGSTDYYALRVGNAGSNDSESINGAKVFKVTGDSRWFMIYQTSSVNFDYPDRFHAAYSTDLINWTKVSNLTPLMTRGNIGQWDQGAIWTGAVFEYNSRLYLYYEGWGSFNQDVNRNTVYYGGGNSRVGVASCTVTDFLNWVNNTPSNVPVAGSVYRIINRNSGKSLEIAGQSTDNQARVTQWDYWGGNNQHFKLVDAGSGYYRITPMHSNKSLDVYGMSTANRGQVVQWDYAGGTNQQWSISSVGGGYYSIINRNSNKGLDVYGWSTTNDAEIDQWDYLGGNNQQWSFAKVSDGTGLRTEMQDNVEDFGEHIRVYPNPTKGDFTIEAGIDGPGNLKLFDVTGKLVMERTISDLSVPQAINYTAKGDFLIMKVSAGTQVFTRKIIIIK